MHIGQGAGVKSLAAGPIRLGAHPLLFLLFHGLLSTSPVSQCCTITMPFGVPRTQSHRHRPFIPSVLSVYLRLAAVLAAFLAAAFFTAGAFLAALTAFALAALGAAFLAAFLGALAFVAAFFAGLVAAFFAGLAAAFLAGLAAAFFAGLAALALDAFAADFLGAFAAFAACKSTTKKNNKRNSSKLMRPLSS